MLEYFNKIYSSWLLLLLSLCSSLVSTGLFSLCWSSSWCSAPTAFPKRPFNLLANSSSTSLSFTVGSPSSWFSPSSWCFSPFNTIPYIPPTKVKGCSSSPSWCSSSWWSPSLCSASSFSPWFCSSSRFLSPPNCFF